MASKSFVSFDEALNDSGVSSDTSRNSFQLLEDKKNSKGEKEKGGVHILVRSKEIGDDAVSDVCSITSSQNKLTKSKSLPIEKLPSVESSGKVKVGSKRKASLEDLKSNSDDDNHNRKKRSLISLKIPSIKPSLKIIKKMVGNVVKSKISSIGSTRNSSEPEVVEEKEESPEVGKDPVEEDVSKNVPVKLEVSEGTITTEEVGNLENKVNFSTSFDLVDSSLVVKKQMLEEKKVLSDRNNDESLNDKVEGDIHEQLLRRPRISSMEPNLMKSSFECPEDEPNSETKYSLPLVKLPQKISPVFGSISGDTLVEIMDKHGEDFYKKYILVDCRYPYEFNGGHIKGAINFYDSDQVSNLFFPEDETKAADIRKKIPIFYCEFSQKRGPGMASALRSIDRKRNIYPNVSYDELYVLDRGYKKFFEEDKHHKYCDPSEYVPMLDKRFFGELEKFERHHQSDRRRVGRILSRQKSCIMRSLGIRRRSLNFKNSD
uniref:M-phase inducer phosphatase n=1 Tax=Strongyloides stercoralis TaxID=6248 RepID=A0A0K0ENF6_STRER